MTLRQRTALLWALVALATCCHFWHCRWGMESAERLVATDLAVVRWRTRASESAQRLRPAQEAWLQYLTNLREQGASIAIKAKEPAMTSTRRPMGELEVFYERLEQQKCQQWFAAIACVDDGVRSNALGIAHQLGIDSKAAFSSPAVMAIYAAELVKQQGPDYDEELRALRAYSPVLNWQMRDGELDRVADPPLRDRESAVGLFAAGGVDRESAIIMGAGLPAALLWLAWWLRLGWRQRSTTPSAVPPK